MIVYLSCVIGLHRWRNVTFDYNHRLGRRCDRCGRTQVFLPRLFGRDWRDTDMQPRKDAHGFY